MRKIPTYKVENGEIKIELISESDIRVTILKADDYIKQDNSDGEFCFEFNYNDKIQKQQSMLEDRNQQDRLNFFANNPEKFFEFAFGVKLPFHQKLILRLINIGNAIKYRKHFKDPIQHCKLWTKCCTTDTWLCDVNNCEYRKLMKDEG